MILNRFITNEKDIVLRIYRYSKVWFNHLLDRIIDLSDMVLMDAYQFPWPIAQNAAKRIARYIGDISWLLRAFPRLSAYKLTGTNWTIIFVGGDQNLLEIRHLFFAEEVIQQELGRIALWRLSAQTCRWLAEGVDLVVCELSRIHPNPPKAALAFSAVTWVQQVIAVPESLEALISGKEGRNIRHKLHRAKKFGFSYRFSRSKAAFDHFYHHMYVPFVKARHGHLALITPYQDQWQRWFVRGGLVLITQDDKPVAGSLCYIANDVCYIIEMGALEADPPLVEQEIHTVVTWYAMIWGHDKGAKFFDLGGSRALCSNGAFINKLRWRAQVVRRKRIYGEWRFLAQNLSPALRDHINKLGFISEIDAKFYKVLLSVDSVSTVEANIEKELSAIIGQGLDGLIMLLANSKPIFYDK